MEQDISPVNKSLCAGKFIFDVCVCFIVPVQIMHITQERFAAVIITEALPAVKAA
jgi:hypothetical protein